MGVQSKYSHRYKAEISHQALGPTREADLGRAAYYSGVLQQDLDKASRAEGPLVDSLPPSSNLCLALIGTLGWTLCCSESSSTRTVHRCHVHLAPLPQTRMRKSGPSSTATRPNCPVKGSTLSRPATSFYALPTVFCSAFVVGFALISLDFICAAADKTGLSRRTQL